MSGHILEAHALALALGRGKERTEVFSDVSFSVKPGDMLAVLGPSGCGKTSLLRVAYGRYQPTSGTVRYGMMAPHEAQRSFRFGVMTQSDALMPHRTVFDNVRLPLEVLGRQDDQAVQRILEQVGLDDVAGRYPWQLSGGMRQRVALARALVHRPGIIFLDEPFSSLDELRREALQRDLRKLQRTLHQTAVIVTHDIEEAVYLADDVLILEGKPGRPVAHMHVDLPPDRPDDLRESDRYYAAVRSVRQRIRTHAV